MKVSQPVGPFDRWEGVTYTAPGPTLRRSLLRGSLSSVPATTFRGGLTTTGGR
jgi:hypothetical protein